MCQKKSVLLAFFICQFRISNDDIAMQNIYAGKRSCVVKKTAKDVGTVMWMNHAWVRL